MGDLPETKVHDGNVAFAKIAPMIMATVMTRRGQSSGKRLSAVDPLLVMLATSFVRCVRRDETVRNYRED